MIPNMEDTFVDPNVPFRTNVERRINCIFLSHRIIHYEVLRSPLNSIGSTYLFYFQERHCQNLMGLFVAEVLNSWNPVIVTITHHDCKKGENL